MTRPSVECLVEAGNELGESPLWCERRRRLYWVDCRAPAILWLEPSSAVQGKLSTPEKIGSIGLTGDHRLVAAMETGLFLADPDAGGFELLTPAALPPGHRFNDGRTDRSGRFWSGTMNDGGRTPTGVLYRCDPDRSLHLLLDDLIVPNSLAWSPDARTMYLADTHRNRIFAFDYDGDEGRLANRRIFVDLSPVSGRPDGSAIDADGCLWNAQYAGGRVVRYAPDGSVDRVVEVPVSNPTCCAFGGPDFETLFITSASQRLTPEQLAREPLAGGLFAVVTGARGLPESRYRGVP